MLELRKHVIILLSLFIAACSATSSPTSTVTLPSPSHDNPTLTATEPVSTITQSPTSSPQPRKLTICLGAQPDSLWQFGSNMHAKNNVLEAIYDGPIDQLGYEFQPVILEKLPSLADGDAQIDQVPVAAGDWVVNDTGEPVQLQPGEIIRPFGCNSPRCAIEWDGGNLEMAQLSAMFTLQDGIKWSDGEPLTASDSLFSYNIAVSCVDEWNASCGHNGLFRPISSLDSSERTASYTLIDELTTRWVSMPGYLDPYYQTNFFIPLPEHLLGELPINEMFENEKTAVHPIGWGPYVIEDWNFDKGILLTKNPNYHRASQGLPRFDQLEFLFVGQNVERNLELIFSGKCDFLDLEASIYFENISMEDLIALDLDAKIGLHYSAGSVWEHLDFSLLHADYDDGIQVGLDRPDFFGDVRTRRAIAMCLDWDKFGRSTSELQPADRLYSYVPADHPLFNPDILSYTYDPEVANELLEESGWLDHDHDPATPRQAMDVINVPDGTLFSFTYSTTNSPQRVKLSEQIATSLADCGIQVTVENLPVSEFFADPPVGNLASRRFDMAQFASIASVDPSCNQFTIGEIPGDPDATNPDGTPRFPNGWQGQNISGYSSPEFEQACSISLEKLPGQPGYAENHLLAQEIFAKDIPVIPIYMRGLNTISRPDFCGHFMDPTARSDIWNIEEFGYGTDC